MAYEASESLPVTPGSAIGETRTWLPKLLVFLGVHVMLGLLMVKFSSIATAHALLVIAIGVAVAAFDSRGDRVACVAAYIVGAEVLWRMTQAEIPWETGKYAVSLIFLISICRNFRFTGPLLPVLYLALLVPSAIMILALNGNDAIGDISFNLSGPAALTVAAWFFWRVRLSKKQLRLVTVSIATPIIAIAVIVVHDMMTNPWISYGYGKNSNFAGSGGFGPNQVSDALGLGALFVLFLTLDETLPVMRRLMAVLVALWLGVQSTLTFSRGGMYNVAAAALLAFPFLLKDPGTRARVLVGVVLFLILGNYVLLPRLQAFTSNAFSDRFENVDTTGRTELAESDVQIWRDNPVLGVGPGQAEFSRPADEEQFAAHTEFTRLLAEHGTLGFAALLLLLIVGLQRIITAQSDQGRALTAALIGWSLFYMLHSGMRTGAPSFALGLSYAALLYRERRSIDFIVRQSNRARSAMGDYWLVQRAFEEFITWRTTSRRA